MPILTIGDAGDFLLDTVEYDPKVAVTTDIAIKAIQDLTSPLPRDGRNSSLDLTEEGLSELERLYDKLSEGALQEQQDSLARYHAGHRSGSTELPFVWAVWKVKQRMAAGVLDIDDPETNIALSRLQMFSSVYSAWRRHPRLQQIMRELRNPEAFLHTVGQLSVADYLYSHGNIIGFSIENTVGVANPDLYFKFLPTERVFIEVKAMKALTWEKGREPSKEEIRKAIRNKLKKGNQINRSKPGAVVVITNYPSVAFCEYVDAEIESFLRHKGRDRPHMAGVISMHVRGLSGDGQGESYSVSLSASVQPFPNPHCALTKNPFRFGMAPN